VRIRDLASVLAFALTACATAGPPVLGSELAAWHRIAETLPGQWRASWDGHAVDVSYRLTARDSVLIETWMPGTSAETITAYHRDGEAVMLTHYCAQGNQPRLRLASVDDGTLVFRRFDATNLQPDAAALAELVLDVDGDTLTRTDVYAQGEEEDRTTLVFVRAQD
jgi:hypothetical protein